MVSVMLVTESSRELSDAGAVRSTRSRADLSKVLWITYESQCYVLEKPFCQLWHGVSLYR